MHTGPSTEKLLSMLNVTLVHRYQRITDQPGVGPKELLATTCKEAGNLGKLQNDCSNYFQQVDPRALYLHCAKHELSLAFEPFVFKKKITKIYYIIHGLHQQVNWHHFQLFRR